MKEGIEMKKIFLLLILLILGLILFSVIRGDNEELVLYAPKDDSLDSVEQYYKDIYGDDFTEIVGRCCFDNNYYYGVNIKNEPQIVKFRKTLDGDMEECMMFSNGDKTYTLFGEKIHGEYVIFVANFGKVGKIVFYNSKNDSTEFVLPSFSKGVFYLKNNIIDDECKYDVYNVDGTMISGEEVIHFID